MLRSRSARFERMRANGKQAARMVAKGRAGLKGKSGDRLKVALPSRRALGACTQYGPAAIRNGIPSDELLWAAFQCLLGPDHASRRRRAR